MAPLGTAPPFHSLARSQDDAVHESSRVSSAAKIDWTMVFWDSSSRLRRLSLAPTKAVDQRPHPNSKQAAGDGLERPKPQDARCAALDPVKRAQVLAFQFHERGPEEGRCFRVERPQSAHDVQGHGVDKRPCGELSRAAEGFLPGARQVRLPCTSARDGDPQVLILGNDRERGLADCQVKARSPRGSKPRLKIMIADLAGPMLIRIRTRSAHRWTMLSARWSSSALRASTAKSSTKASTAKRLRWPYWSLIQIPHSAASKSAIKSTSVHSNNNCDSAPPWGTPQSGFHRPSVREPSLTQFLMPPRKSRTADHNSPRTPSAQSACKIIE